MVELSGIDSSELARKKYRLTSIRTWDEKFLIELPIQM